MSSMPETPPPETLSLGASSMPQAQSPTPDDTVRSDNDRHTADEVDPTRSTNIPRKSGEDQTHEKLGLECTGETCSPEESQRQLAGFSADQFEKYEQRMKERIGHAHFEDSPFDSVKGFDDASDIEKGVVDPDFDRPSTPKPAYIPSSTCTVTSNFTVNTVNIPEKRQGKIVRQIRHQKFNVYRRLFAFVFVANLAGLAGLVARNHDVKNLPLNDVATAASANIFVAIWIRQDYVVNFLFKTCWMVPHSAPLWLRKRVAKVYEHGGIHSGAGVSGTMWFILLTGILTYYFVQNTLRSIPILTLTYVLLTAFIAILALAHPRFRFMSHNSFEMSHRFAGWTAVGLFWAEILLIAHNMAERSQNSSSMGQTLIKLPSFWFLVVSTMHIVLPWLRLRKWHFQPERLSSHAMRLNFEPTLAPLSGLAISESPLKEWHPFATFPNDGGGGAMIISNAGDWTKRNIDNPKTRYWVKGLPKTGVLSMAIVFRKVVVVTTGSGIGPCLSFLREPSRKTECRVLWSTPNPLRTYGFDIFDSVLKADPQATIIDTTVAGRPDMVAHTYRLYVESGAEAVFVISNPKLTRKVVYAMETRGIPAFGPVWDS